MKRILIPLLLGALAACADAPTHVSIRQSIPPPSRSQGETTGLVPLTELGSGFYLGSYQGGLYPGGSNTAPEDHAAEGRARAQLVQRLNGDGQPSTSGKYVLLSIGMSNAATEWCNLDSDNAPCSKGTFTDRAKKDSGVNSKALVIANGAQGTKPIRAWLTPDSPEYDRVRDKVLKPLKVTELQVQVVWVKQANGRPTISLPDPAAEAIEFERQLGTLLRTLRTRYPNLKQVFVSTRNYGGYATTDLNPEPYAYEYGFAAKWVIEAQIEQMRSGMVDPDAGDLDHGSAAPWVAWASYLWADGTTPRSDGMAWFSTDFQNDGTHPSQSGVDKIGTALLTHFKTSEFTTCWFLAKPICP